MLQSICICCQEAFIQCSLFQTGYWPAANWPCKYFSCIVTGEGGEEGGGGGVSLKESIRAQHSMVKVLTLCQVGIQQGDTDKLQTMHC